MVLSLNASNRVLSDPTGDHRLDRARHARRRAAWQTRVYTKSPTAADAGKKVTVPLDLAAKYTMTVADYSGARAGRVVYADFAETVIRAGHTTPAVDAPAGAWVVSHWADKSSLDHRLHAAGLRDRPAGACAAPHRPDLQRRSPTPPARSRPGSYGGLTATADSRQRHRARPGRSCCARSTPTAPTAAFTFTCTSPACDFDASSSSDPDGAVASLRLGLRRRRHGHRRHAEPRLRDHGDPRRDADGDRRRGHARLGRRPRSRWSAPTRRRRRRSPRAARFLVCSFDASASSDTDGTVDVVRLGLRRRRHRHHAGADASHTFDATGTYVVPSP